MSLSKVYQQKTKLRNQKLGDRDVHVARVHPTSSDDQSGIQRVSLVRHSPEDAVHLQRAENNWNKNRCSTNPDRHVDDIHFAIRGQRSLICTKSPLAILKASCLISSLRTHQS